jgi:hypothetical protein
VTRRTRTVAFLVEVEPGEDPIQAAMMRGMRRLGEVVYEIGGTDSALADLQRARREAGRRFDTYMRVR